MQSFPEYRRIQPPWVLADSKLRSILAGRLEHWLVTSKFSCFPQKPGCVKRSILWAIAVEMRTRRASLNMLLEDAKWGRPSDQFLQHGLFDETKNSCLLQSGSKFWLYLRPPRVHQTWEQWSIPTVIYRIGHPILRNVYFIHTLEQIDILLIYFGKESWRQQRR